MHRTTALLLRTLPIMVLSVAFAASALAADRAPSAYEAAVQKSVTTWFLAKDLAVTEAQLTADVGTLPDGAQSALVQMGASSQKLVTDAARGVSSFETEAAVNFAVALAAVDCGTARSALSRLNTALIGAPVSAQVADDLVRMATQLAELLQELGAP